MVVKHDVPNNLAGRSTNIYANPRADEIEQNEVTAERDGAHIPKTDATGYRIREEPYGTRRHVRVVLMGAGASTLNFLRQSELKMQNLKVTVYEKNRDVGGTWFENRYPGE
jgi:hypothetical protein